MSPPIKTHWLVAALVVLCVVSLGLLTWVDGVVHRGLLGVAPPLAFLADVRLPSLLVCLGLCWLASPRDAWRLPRADRRLSIVRLGLLWLLPSALVIFVLRFWVVPLPGVADVVAFLLTGMLAEEFLFRGAIYGLGQRLRPGPLVRRFDLGVVLSATFFGLSHFQYHGFRLVPEAWFQVGVNVTMGFFSGAMRQSGESLWPPVLLHFCNNAMVVARGP